MILKLGYLQKIGTEKPILLQIAKSGSPQQCVHAAWSLATSSLVMSDESRNECIKTLLDRLPDLNTPTSGEVAMAILRLGAKAPPRDAIVAVGEYLVDKKVKNPVRVLRDLRYYVGKNAAPATDAADSRAALFAPCRTSQNTPD